MSSHLKGLVKRARAFGNQLLQDPWGPAGSLGEPVPLDGFSVVFRQKTKKQKKNEFLAVFHILENKQTTNKETQRVNSLILRVPAFPGIP